MPNEVKQNFKISVDGEEQLRDYTKKLKENDEAGKQLSGSNKALGASFKSLAVAVGGMAVIGKVSSFLRESIDLTNKQIASDRRLETIARNVTGATNDQIDSLKRLSDEMQKVTTVGDEVTQVGQSQLLSFSMATESAEALTASMLDLAVAQYGSDVNGQQLIQTANQLGKAYKGQIEGLTRVGITVDENQKKLLKEGSELEKIEALTAIVAQNYGGLAEAIAQTPEGKITQLKNEFGDLREELGARLLPSIGEMTEGISRLFDEFDRGGDLEQGFNIVEDAMKRVSQLATGVAGGLDAVFTGVSISLLEVSANATKAFSIMNKFNPILYKAAQSAGDLSKALKEQAREERSSLADRVVIYGETINAIGSAEVAQSSATASTKASTTANKENVTSEKEKAKAVKEYSATLGELMTVEMPKYLTGTDALTQHIKDTSELISTPEPTNLDKVKTFMDEYGAIVQQGMNTVGNIFSSAYSMQREELDRKMKDEIKAVNESTMSEKKKAKEIKKIESKAEKDRQKIAMKEWRSKVIMSIANTALAVTAALPSIPKSIAVGAIGATNTGIIMANKPKFYYGSRDASGAYSEIGGNSQGDQVNASVRSGELIVQAGKDAQIAKQALNGTTNNSTSQAFSISPNITIQGNADESVLMKIPNMIVDTIQNANFNGMFNPAVSNVY